MNENQEQKLSNIEINDLIEKSVVDAIERRKSSLDLTDLSESEVNNIIGGDDIIDVCTQQTMGFIGEVPESTNIFRIR